MSAHATDLRTRRIGATKKPQLRVVKKKSTAKGRARRSVSIYVTAGLIAAAIVTAILLEQVVLAQSAFQLSDLRSELMAAEEKHEVLLLEAAQLDSSARIERYARENLGMVDPAPDGIQYIVADIKQPKQLRGGIGRKHKTTLPTEGVATGDPYAGEGSP